MRKIIVATALTILFVGFIAQAQTNPPAPGPENKKLEVFVGTWTGDAKAETTPFGKGGTVTSTMTCAMYAGGYDLVCDSDDSGPMGKVKGHSIHGYNREKKQYFMFGIDSTGYGGPGTAKVEGPDWTFEANDVMGGKTFWFRTSLKVVSLKEMTFKSEYSEDGKVWKLQAQGKMLKK
jgi:hypothetical protein